MKLSCVLTACNDIPLYYDFIPLFIKTWNKLYPDVDVKIIFISDSIPTKFIKYSDNLILFKPLPNISTAFISQYIRLLYPAILDYKHGILITDMDMLPMNRSYYTKNIEIFPDDKLIYLRPVLLNLHQIAMCYNIAHNTTWSKIFNIHSKEDINKRLINVYSKIQYIDGHGKQGWFTDQQDFFWYVFKWAHKTNNFIVLQDKHTGFKRLDRARFIFNSQVKKQITNGFFSDYHCLRPFKQYETINNEIYNLL